MDSGKMDRRKSREKGGLTPCDSKGKLTRRASKAPAIT